MKRLYTYDDKKIQEFISKLKSNRKTLQTVANNIESLRTLAYEIGGDEAYQAAINLLYTRDYLKGFADGPFAVTSLAVIEKWAVEFQRRVAKSKIEVGKT